MLLILHLKNCAIWKFTLLCHIFSFRKHFCISNSSLWSILKIIFYRILYKIILHNFNVYSMSGIFGDSIIFMHVNVQFFSSTTFWKDNPFCIKLPLHLYQILFVYICMDLYIGVLYFLNILYILIVSQIPHCLGYFCCCLVTKRLFR